MAIHTVNPIALTAAELRRNPTKIRRKREPAIIKSGGCFVVRVGI